MASPPTFAIDRYLAALGPVRFGRSIVHFRETSSTMNIARQLAADNVSDTVIVADLQTAGRGSVTGRLWKSNAGLNILVTLLLKMPIADAMKLPVATPVAIVMALRQLGVDAWIKWPNDIWVDNFKISGMLVENPSGDYRSVGIGINVNERFAEQRDVAARGVVELLPGGADVARENLLADVVARLETLLALPTSQIVHQFRSHNRLLGRRIIVMPKKLENPERIDATAIKIDDNGFLVVKYANDTTAILTAEEVTVRPE